MEDDLGSCPADSPSVPFLVIKLGGVALKDEIYQVLRSENIGIKEEMVIRDWNLAALRLKVPARHGDWVNLADLSFPFRRTYSKILG